MGKTALRITAGILIFVLFLCGMLPAYLSGADPTELSDELRQLQLSLGFYTSGAGQEIVNAARAEYASNHGVKSGEKYWRGYCDYYGIAYQNIGAWCVCFVYYCADLAGYLGPDACMGDKWHINCRDSWNFFLDQGRAYTSPDYVPEAGDLIYFGHDPGPTYQSFTHIAIVEYVEDGIVHTIEGNYGQTVSKRQVAYPVGTPTDGVYIEGYAKPDYPSAANGSAEQRIFRYLTIDMGLPASSACGILANIEHESGFDPNNVGDNGTSYGICQWHKERRAALKTYCQQNQLNCQTLEGQLAYLRYELETAYPVLLSELKAMENTAQGAYNAAYAWCVRFERPSNPNRKAQIRGAAAQNTYWPKYGC